MKSFWKENAPEKINKLQMDMLQETLDEIAEVVGYKPNHGNDFTGDKLVEIIKQLRDYYETHKKEIQAP